MFKIFQETKTIKWIYAQKELIDFSPAYQRRGNLWKEEQQQLLIDSILNGLDIPKFYFQFMPPVLNGTHYNYAIIDGKQRIEAILGFIEDKFPLSEDFSFLDSDSFNQFENVSGKLFSEIENSNPALIARFWQYELNIVFMDTTNPDIINELFVRLNSGLSVSTSEKRNANGGIVVWNVNDSTVKGSETGTSFRQALYFMECGFNLHDTMIWIKDGGGAVGSNKCYTQNFEYMFVFSKGSPKTINLIYDKPNGPFGQDKSGVGRRKQTGEKKIEERKPAKEFSRRNNWWYIPPQICFE